MCAVRLNNPEGNRWGGPILEISPFRGWTTDLKRMWQEADRPALVLGDMYAPLDFLADLDGLRQLGLSGVSEFPDGVVGECLDLEALMLATDCTNRVDLTRLTRLRDLDLNDHRKGTERLPSSIQRLVIWRCRWRDLQPLAPLSGLREAELSAHRLEDLSGVEAATELTSLRLSYIRAEQPFATLHPPRLCEVSLESSSRIRSLNGIEAVAGSLTHLQLVDLPYVESLAPMRSLTNLQHVGLLGRTNILDGDLGPLSEIPGLTALVDGRRHYRPSARELRHLEPESRPIPYEVYDENGHLLEEGIHRDDEV